MTNLYDGLISDQWPRPDAVTKAFAYALQQAVKSVIGYMDKSMCTADIDKLEEPVLDSLAVENRAINYDQDYSIGVKRELVKNILINYQTAGTASAVKQFIQDVYDESTVECWYDYNGDPGHYRINVIGLYSEEKAAKIIEAVAKLTKFSAILDAVNFIGDESDAEIDVAAATVDIMLRYTSTVY